MGKCSTEQAAGAQRIETLGGGYALKWDDETLMGVNAHAALLSQFAKAGGFLDRLVETCPMRLTSNNAPEVREALLEMVRRAGKGGVPVGALGLDPVFVRELFAEGLDFLAYGIDTILMYQTCREIMRSVFGAV